MDITSVSGASAFSQLSIGNNIATAVAAKTLESQRAQGADALKLLQAATVPPTSGGSDHSLDVQG
jgi:hypothetical protein